MKFLPIFALAVLVSLHAAAQVPDSLQHRYDSLAGAGKTRYDSASRRINNRIDSIQLRANKLANPDLSLQGLTQKLQARRMAARDSVKAIHEMDSIKGGLRHKIDSLKGLNLPTEKYSRKLDSVSNLSPAKYIEQAEAKKQALLDRINKPVNTVEDKINDPLRNAQGKVNEKLDLMRKEGGEGANIPGNVNVKGADLPGVDANLPSVGAKLDVNVPGVDVDNPLGKIESPLKGNEQLSGLGEKANELKSIPQQQVDRVKSIDGVQAVEGKLDAANQLTDKAQAYQQDVSNIAKGDLGEVKEIPKAMEERVMKMDELGELQKQSAEATKYQDMLSKGNDPDAMKALAKQEVVKYATDHFAGQQVALQAAMDKVSKLKSKYSEVKSLTDLPKRVPNPMKGKPLIERLVPGLTLQIQKSQAVQIDFNPVLSYRVTGRFSAGAGWNERVSFQKWNQTIPTDRIFGPRAFTSFSFKKGFSLKAELEKMSVFIPRLQTPYMSGPVLADAGGRLWIWSAFVGIKKDYQFFKKVKGNFQVLYNVYDDRDASPYVERLNVRMGWEVALRKKK